MSAKERLLRNGREGQQALTCSSFVLFGCQFKLLDRVDVGELSCERLPYWIGRLYLFAEGHVSSRSRHDSREAS